MTIPQNIQQLSQKLMLALKTIPELSITVTGNHINYTQTEIVINLAPNSQKYHPYKKNTRSYSGIHLPELLKLALRENLMLTPISIPLNATIQQKLQLCLNEENCDYTPIYRYFNIGKTLHEQKRKLTAANLTKEVIQKQLHNEFKTTAEPTNSHYKLRAALRLYDLFHTCKNVLQNPILQPLKIQYIGKLTELKFQQFSDQISSIILDYYLEITDNEIPVEELTFTANITTNIQELRRDQKPPVTPASKFVGFIRLSLADSCVEDIWNFDSKKFFALDVEFSAVSDKISGNKLLHLKKIFYRIDGFGGASTPSKFSGIIKLSFTLESSLNKAKDLAVSKKILVNSEIRKINNHLNWEVIVRKIPVDLPKLAVISVFSKFGKVVSKAWVEFESSNVTSMVAAKWSVLMEKDFVRVALAVGDKQTWISRDYYRILLYTLSIGITAHDLSKLLAFYESRTCFIDHNSVSYVCNRCAVVCFDSKKQCHWFFASFQRSEFEMGWSFFGLFGNSGAHGKRVVTSYDQVHLAIFFGGKTWAQVASSSPFHVFSLSLLNIGVVLGTNISHTIFASFDVSGFNDCLAFLECSLELVTDQVFDILKKLGSVNPVSLPFVFHVSPPVVSDSLALDLDSDMALDGVLVPPVSFLPKVDVVLSDFSPSSLKVLTTKVCSLESKLVALEVLIHLILARLDLLGSGLNINVPAKQEDVVRWHLSLGNMVSFVIETKLRSGVKPWIANRFKGVQIFMSGLDKGYLGTDVAVIMNNSLACHVSRVKEISGRIISASEVNSLIAKAINSSTFVVLSENFNENGAGRKIEKTIDYIFVNENLALAIAGHAIGSVSDFFNTDHKAVIVSVDLGGLLNSCLNSLYKQANKDCWKFNIKNADGAKWVGFRNCAAFKLSLTESEFSDVKACGNIDIMWTILEKSVVELANKIFLKCWFSEFQCLRNRHFSRFFGLKILAAKIVKKFSFGDAIGIDCLIKTWLILDETKVCAFNDLVFSNAHPMSILKHLLLVCKSYRKSKMHKSKLAEEAFIKKAIEKQIENFLLDHLVVDDELVVELTEVKSNVNRIMEGWTRRQMVPLTLSDLWTHQYAPLDYVRNDTFSGVMHSIGLSKLLLVIDGLPDRKTAGLSDIPNKLWKHGSDTVIDCLLRLLNVCLNVSGVPALWRKAWVLMIPKSYDWDEVFTNTHLIALVETLRKILSKILSDHISFACSKFGILQGRIENSGGVTSYFTVGIFVDNTIWVRSCQTSTQYALDIASEFFEINDISINNDKTVAILINQGVKIASLNICGQPISIAKKGEVHHYLRIFLFTEGLFKSSVAKVHSDVRFFVNVVLKKAITNKQFSYLVSAVLQPIISYWIQFSFVLLNVCYKWNVMIRKSLKLKACLPRDFSDAALYHSLLYDLKTFEQVQSESKLAAVVSFSNALGILGHLFNHRFLDLQIMGWALMNLLQFPVRLHVSPVNNFLAGVVKIFLHNELSLVNNLPSAFCSPGVFSMSIVLGDFLYFSSICSLKCFSMAFSNRLLDKKGHVIDWKTFWWWKRLNLKGPVPSWFRHTSQFLCANSLVSSNIAQTGQLQGLNILNSQEFSIVQSNLHEIWSSLFDIFTDGSLKNLGLVDVSSGAAVYFPIVDLSLGVRI
ncbi:hypothetical protein G9A89_017885 [Geosiphon pyriformis]|nr:hypothetical protein G9A89_017885 [Geosiphon pyriformis]